jgi:hypothetical protein
MDRDMGGCLEGVCINAGVEVDVAVRRTPLDLY